MRRTYLEKSLFNLVGWKRKWIPYFSLNDKIEERKVKRKSYTRQDSYLFSKEINSERRQTDKNIETFTSHT